MLTEHHKRHLLAFTCPECGEPLGRFHAYPLDPAQCLSQTVECAPMHLDCAQTYAETHHTLRAVAVIKATPTTPSGKLFRTLRDDPSTTCIRLYTPERIDFHHVTHNNGADIIRPATREEVFQWLKDALTDAQVAAHHNDDELAELLRHLGKLGSKLAK